MGVHRGPCCNADQGYFLHSATPCPGVVMGELETVSIEEFLPEVEVEAKGVSRDLALWNIREACIEFAEETRFMRRREVISLQRGVSDYFLTPLKNEQVLAVSSLCYHGKALSLSSLSRASSVSLSFAPPYQLTIHDEIEKDCVHCASVDYVAMPDRDSCEVDRQFSRRYHNAIVKGALSKILSLTRTKDNPHPFYNPAAAERNASIFRSEKSRAKTDVALEFRTGARMSSFSRAQIEAGF